MTSDSKPHVSFSQRVGLELIPPQLKLGEVSVELRRLLSYYVSLEIDRETNRRSSISKFEKGWRRVATDLHVKYFKHPIEQFRFEPFQTKERLNVHIRKSEFGSLFDLIEFLVRHPSVSDELKTELGGAFVEARAAYRVFDNQYIAAIGMEEQASAYERAISSAEAQNATAARKQLIAAGVAIRNGDWAGSVRNSIHAVEAMAVQLAPETNSLGTALKVLEQHGHLHGSLKSAFGSLYGYSSDEEGVRHALVFNDESKVDETDALFMLGACASFVSYLLARND